MLYCECSYFEQSLHSHCLEYEHSIDLEQIIDAVNDAEFDIIPQKQNPAAVFLPQDFVLVH